jgi:hypothetical protein
MAKPVASQHLLEVAVVVRWPAVAVDQVGLEAKDLQVA